MLPGSAKIGPVTKLVPFLVLIGNVLKSSTTSRLFSSSGFQLHISFCPCALSVSITCLLSGMPKNSRKRRKTSQSSKPDNKKEVENTRWFCSPHIILLKIHAWLNLLFSLCIYKLYSLCLLIAVCPLGSSRFWLWWKALPLPARKQQLPKNMVSLLILSISA